MNNKSNVRPFLTSDPKYTQHVASTIKAKDPIEDLKLEYLIETLKSFDIYEDPYSVVSLQNLNPESLKSIIAQSFEKINNSILNSEQLNNLYRLWDYLSEENELEKANIIFAFGGPNISKATESAKLYKEKWVSKIIYTGNVASYIAKSDLPESEFLKNIAVKEGIKEEDIIIENKSINSTENAVFGIQKLIELNIDFEKIILITLPYHMRRSSLTLKSAIYDKGINDVYIIKHIAASAKYTRENYFKDSNGWTYIFYEFIKLYGGRLMKHY